MTRKELAFGILGSGVALPERRVTSAEVDALCSKPEGWTERQFGLTARHWATGGETSSSLAADAARRALSDAALEPDGIDVIVGACAVMEQPIPGTAALVQRRLGLGRSGIPAFDVNATCLSFLVALDAVAMGFALGRWRRALIVTADIASAGLDFTTPEASAIFGDGAAAFVLAAGGPHLVRSSRLATYGDHADLCRLDAGGTRVRLASGAEAFAAQASFRMDGPGVFKATARAYPRFLSGLLRDAGLDKASLSVVVPHQASSTALRHLRRSLPSAVASRVADIFAEHGNQMAASLPHALHQARQKGWLASGTHGLLIGSAAGLSLGGMVITW